MSPGFSSLVSPCHLVGRLVPDLSSWRSLVAGACLAVLLVASRRGPGRHAFVLRRGVVLCLIPRPVVSSRFSSHRLDGRLVARLPCPAGRVALRACSSRRGVSFFVSCGGESLASRLISARADERRFPSRRLEVGACLPSLPSCDEAMPSRHRRSRLFPIILLLLGMCSVRCLPCDPSSPASCSRGYRSYLIPLIRFEANGTACCLAIGGAWLIMSRRLMYIMNMMYAMYIKDTRIQGYKYDEYMGRCG